MKLPTRKALDTLGITQPEGERTTWFEAFTAGGLFFVYFSTCNITDSPLWQWLIVAGVAVLAAILFTVFVAPAAETQKVDARPDGEIKTPEPSAIQVANRRARGARFERLAALFMTVAGLLVVLISAGSQWWGYSTLWGVVAAGFYVPSIFVFAVVYRRLNHERYGNSSLEEWAA